MLDVSLQFMDLRTRYTALVTLTTQHVKYISDALRRLEEEEVNVLPSFCGRAQMLYVVSDWPSSN